MGGVLANDLNLDLDSVQEYSVAQGASIRDFSDVYPTDWAYQALAELVETYGCVGGYPDGAFRGEQPITRYEMAAILSACLESMSAKMDMMEDSMENMENMEMLKAEFSEELIALKGTVDDLEAKVSALEETQFSTTTKAEFEIATDFVFFSADNEEARGVTTGTTEEDVTTEALIYGNTWNGTNGQVNLSGRLASGGQYSDYATGDTSNYLLVPVYTGKAHSSIAGNARMPDKINMIVDANPDTAGVTVQSFDPFSDGVDDNENFSAESGITNIVTSLLDGSNNSLTRIDLGEAGDSDVSIDLRLAVLKRPTQAEAKEWTAANPDGGNGYTDTDDSDDQTLLTNAQLLATSAEYLNTLIDSVVTGTRRTRTETPYGEDNSGLALSSSVEIAFTTSFTGSDKLTFKLEGDVMSMENHYLALGNFYDVADNGNANVEFSGFSYERNFDLGVPVKLTLGTDVDDLDPIVGLDTYYAGSGYDGYGPGAHGDAGIGFSTALLNSDAGTVNFSASYAVGGDHASDQTGNKGFFGEDTNRGFAVALNWDGALFGGNESRFTVAYQNSHFEEVMDDAGMVESYEQTKSKVHLVAGTYFTETISLSGIYSFGKVDFAKSIFKDNDLRQWMFALNMDDAFFPGNSAGIAYGTPEYVMDAGEGMNPTKVLELYYSFKVNDNFTVPVYLDFINNAGNYENGNGTSKNAFGIAVRPTLTF